MAWMRDAETDQVLVTSSLTEQAGRSVLNESGGAERLAPLRGGGDALRTAL